MELPQVISEVITLWMNEEVASQLHSGAISIMDEHQARIVELEESLEGMTRINHQLKKDYIVLASNMEQVRMQSVMCHALLMHYVETHWAPIGHLLTQIGELSSCGLAPPTGHCECHIVNESDVAQGEIGPDSPSSLPSLQSVSSSSINSVYHSSSFLQSAPGPSPNTVEEDFTIIFQGGVIEVSIEGFLLLGDEGWSSGCGGCDEMDPFAGRG